MLSNNPQTQEKLKNTPLQEQILSKLKDFHGTESYFKNFTGIKYTDGVNYLAETLGAYWLIDLIGSYKNHKNIKPFLVWRIECFETERGRQAIITAREDTNEPVLIKQKISLTDFKLNEYELYCIDGVLLLKGEY